MIPATVIGQQDDEIDGEDTQEWPAEEFADTGRISRILFKHDDDARARILAHLVAFYGLGEIYKCEVLHQGS